MRKFFTAAVLVAGLAVVPAAASASPLPPPPNPCQFVFSGGVHHCHVG